MSYQHTRPFLSLKPVRAVNKRRLELLFRDGSNTHKKVFYGIERVGGVLLEEEIEAAGDAEQTLQQPGSHTHSIGDCLNHQ